MKKRHVMRALVAAATALALTACGSTGSSDTSKSTSTASAASTSSGSEADTENTITIPAGESVSQDSDVTAMVAVDFTTMDPMDTSDTLSGGVQRMMMDGLFGFDENMQIIPMLATSYEANDEATEYTIHLREGVSFTDGTPWNADALIANVNKWADKSLGLKRTTFLCNVLDHAEKIDDYTVKIYLSQSFGAFISNLAHPATLIMSPKQIAGGHPRADERLFAGAARERESAGLSAHLHPRREGARGAAGQAAKRRSGGGKHAGGAAADRARIGD